jgi:hypothetical protein
VEHFEEGSRQANVPRGTLTLPDQFNTPNLLIDGQGFISGKPKGRSRKDDDRDQLIRRPSS